MGAMCQASECVKRAVITVRNRAPREKGGNRPFKPSCHPRNVFSRRLRVSHSPGSAGPLLRLRGAAAEGAERLAEGAERLTGGIVRLSLNHHDNTDEGAAGGWRVCRGGEGRSVAHLAFCRGSNQIGVQGAEVLAQVIGDGVQVLLLGRDSDVAYYDIRRHKLRVRIAQDAEEDKDEDEDRDEDEKEGEDEEEDEDENQRVRRRRASSSGVERYHEQC
eukprot:2962587-Rhodomonas_salina.2